MIKKLLFAARAVVIFILLITIITIITATAFAADEPEETEEATESKIEIEYGFIENLYSQIYLNSSLLLLDWSGCILPGVDYTVAIFDDISRTEPIYLYPNEISSLAYADIQFDPNVKSLTVEMTYLNDGEPSQINTKTIPINSIMPNTSDILTNASQVLIEFDAPKTMYAEISVNGESGTINMNAGKGSFSIKLAASIYNEVEIRYSLDDLTATYIINFQAIVDNVPPILRLPENKSVLFVDADEFILAGVTEPGASVVVDGASVEVNSDGAFIYTVELYRGENIIKVTATDMAGNVTKQDVIINRPDNIKDNIDVVSNDDTALEILKNFLPLILSFAGSLLLFILILLVSRRFEKASNKALYVVKSMRRIIIMTTIICAVSEGYCLWKYITFRNLSEGGDYFALAKESIDKAYDALRDVDLYGRLSKYVGIAVCAGVFLTIIMTFMIKIINKRINNPKPEKTKDIIESDKDKIENLPEDVGEVTELTPESDPAADIPEPEEKNNGEESSVKFVCPNCGEQFDNPVKFCGKCGEAIK